MNHAEIENLLLEATGYPVALRLAAKLQLAGIQFRGRLPPDCRSAYLRGCRELPAGYRQRFYADDSHP